MKRRFQVILAASEVCALAVAAAALVFGRRRRAAEQRLTRALAAAHESAAILTAVSDATTDAIFVKDRRGHMLIANPATLRAIGKDASAVIGRTDAEFLGPEHGAPLMENDRRVLRTGRPEMFEESPAPGVTFLSNKTPYRDERGNVVGIIGIARDVTAQKQMEAERADLLAREQRARAEAEATNRAKDDFLATLSHELRTPLNAILGWVRLLRSGSLDEPTARRALAIIDRNVQTQTQLITDLLDVSRIISGKMRLDVRPVDFARVVHAAVDAIRPAAQAASVEIMVDVAESWILGDATRLQQVVSNLLSNAVKFTPSGGHVRVHLSRFAERVELVVSDTGKGIDPAFLPKIFDRFRQADASTTRQYSGLGLGLAIVRHLVELHGGIVTARSEGEGKGTDMRVSLPIGEVPAVVEPEPITRRDVGEHPVHRLVGVKVLVVDDNADTCDLLSTLLNAEGADAAVAYSGLEALATFDRADPDVVSCDLAMPGMSGHEVVRRLRERAHEAGGVIPAIALTAYARLDDQQEAIAAGFSAYLCKPTSPSELVATIRSLLPPPEHARSRSVPARPGRAAVNGEPRAAARECR